MRALLKKFSACPDDLGDHDCHVTAVGAASKRDTLAKQMHKALDRRYHAQVKQVGKLASVADLRRHWDGAVQRGDIPGAYWAVLTHPLATHDLMRHLFADVHMLSHLVGAANRADIVRLRQLEEEKSALEDKVCRQQARLREAITSRDATIRELRALLLSGRTLNDDRPAGSCEPQATDNARVADLQRQLARETQRRERAEAQVQELAAASAKAREDCTSLEDEIDALKAELAAAEQRLDDAVCPAEALRADLDLAGLTILYVGGRPQQVCRLKLLVEQAAGRLIHHDGGIEDNDGLLAGLVSRADVACFPVDCVSHTAVCTLSGSAATPASRSSRCAAPASPRCCARCPRRSLCRAATGAEGAGCHRSVPAPHGIRRFGNS